MHPSDPTFPHGSNYGYVKGCRPKNHVCPATPSCGDAHREDKKRYTANRDKGASATDAKTTFVARRLRQTLDAKTLLEVATYSGLTVGQIKAVLSRVEITTPRHLSDPLDAAWSWFIHGCDTRAADFPHGTHTGYSTGHCRCLPCTASASVAKKKTHAKPGSPCIDPRTLRAIRGHVTALIDNANIEQVARASGVVPSTIKHLLSGDGYPQNKIVTILGKVTQADVAAAAKENPIDAAPANHYVRTMWAAGFPLTWIAQQAGFDEAVTHRLGREGALVTPKIAAAIADLADRLDGRQADPERDGIPIRQINRAKNSARREGWYPRDCYHPDGTLNLRAIPDHPWTILDEECGNRLLAARLVAKGITQVEAADRVGLNAKTLGRMGLGLVYVGKGTVEIDHHRCYRRVREILETVSAWENAEIGPVTACLSLGFVIPVTGRTATAETREHPELVAWQAEQALADQVAA